eukprot:7311063-Pyramimonas_sp.AAC.2
MAVVGLGLFAVLGHAVAQPAIQVRLYALPSSMFGSGRNGEHCILALAYTPPTTTTEHAARAETPDA